MTGKGKWESGDGRCLVGMGLGSVLELVSHEGADWKIQSKKIR